MSHKGAATAATKPDATKPKGDGKSNRERFLTVGANRVGKAIKALRNLKNISSKKSYEYSSEEWAKARNALTAELNAVDAVFQAALSGKTGEAAKETFKF